MKSKTIGGVRFRLQRYKTSVRLEISEGDWPMVILPASGRNVNPGHLRKLTAWFDEVREELENEDE